jgi:hypothetical protein
MKSCMPEYPCQICYENECDGQVDIKTTFQGNTVGIPTYVCDSCLEDLTYDVVNYFYIKGE